MLSQELVISECYAGAVVSTREIESFLENDSFLNHSNLRSISASMLSLEERACEELYVERVCGHQTPVEILGDFDF